MSKPSLVLPRSVKIPRHLFVAGSAWISRIGMALVQLASVRILMDGLGVEKYAVFALLMGLTGWYALADLGIGVSLQNHISECRAKDQSYDAYMAAAAVLAIALLILTIGLLYLGSPYLGPVFLKHFAFMSNREKTRVFFIIGALFIGTSIGSISYKVWYAEQKGYWANILPLIASLIGLAGIATINRVIVSDRLYLSLVAYTIPPSLFPLIAFTIQIIIKFKERATISAGIFFRVIKRAGHFWAFAVMAAAVLQVDYLVMSQFIQSHDIAVYNISTKIFGLIFFIYNSILIALWPVLTEELTKNNWEIANGYLRKYLTIGLMFMLVSTICLAWLMPKIISILAPHENIVVPESLIILLGIYQIIRVWTDTFSMVLQSISDLRPFWIYVPIQAIICISMQWTLASTIGLYGIVLGLIGSFVFTVSWALPLATWRHYKASKEVNA